MRSPFLLAFSLGSVVVAAGLTAAPVHAQTTISVPCSGNNGGPAGLIAAITQIGGGSGLIQLAPGCTYTISTPATAANALPVITGRIEIEGENSVIARAANAATSFRIAEVAAGGYLSLTGVTVRGGSAEVGGGILNNGTLSLKFSKVTDNTAVLGGGFLSRPGSLTLLYRSTISDNTASANGAGAFIAAGTLRAVSSLFAGNTAVNAGGGLLVQNGAAKLTASVVTGNRAENGGGIIIVGPTNLQVDRSSKITYNVARRSGGGIFVFEGTAEITKSLVAHNVAGDTGGGIFNNANVNLDHTTVANNDPDNCGGPSPVPGCRNTQAGVKETSRATGKSGGTSAGKHHGKRFHPVSGSTFKVKRKR